MIRALLLTLLTATLLTGCTKATPAGTTANGRPASDSPTAAKAPARQDVDTTAFKALMAKPDGLVLDVRTPAEVQKGTLAGATVINVFAKDFNQRIAALPKDKAILVYCRSGRRSVRASTQLLSAGFTRVYNLKGGILGWQAAGLPVAPYTK
ncbi:MAG: rhodanese-like domain-containing protein [Myxococcales bacterium]|nr:rhodanese-like domain-containing protein [Myxococcales bacterium]